MSRALRTVLAIASACAMMLTHVGPASSAAAKPPPPTMPALDAFAVRIAPVDRSVPKPLFVALHGQCEDAADTCARWSQAVDDRGFLVCPRANVACPQGGA